MAPDLAKLPLHGQAIASVVAERGDFDSDLLAVFFSHGMALPWM